MPLPKRKHLAHGVLVPDDNVPIVFLTVCTKHRKKWLASRSVQDLLVHTWQEATTWLVGRYMILPDHIHAFVAPGTETLPLDNWVRYWKWQFTKAHETPKHRWATDHWDTRLRTFESYDQKWEYVSLNPVRHGLVTNARDWPFQGELNELRWD